MYIKENFMDFEKILNLGVEKNIINETQRNGLIDLYYQNNNEPKQVSTVVKVLYYIGGFIMLGAMTVLMSGTMSAIESSMFSRINLPRSMNSICRDF